MINPQIIASAPQRTWPLTASILACAMIISASVFFEIRQGAFRRALNRLTAQQKELTALQPESLKEIALQGENIKIQMQELSATQVIWSKLVEKIEATVPKNKETSAPAVALKSYNGNADGVVTVSAATIAGSADPMADIAQTVRAFTLDPAFKDVFVPSITRSIAPDGSTVFSFSMGFSYQKQNF